MFDRRFRHSQPPNGRGSPDHLPIRPISLDKRIPFMVATATNHRPANSNLPRTNRMAKADKDNRQKARQTRPTPSPPAFWNPVPSFATRSPPSKSSSAKGRSCRWASTSQLPIEGIPTGSLSLDIALGGQGIPRGRIIEVFGPESSGKTTLALHVDRPGPKGRRHRRVHRRRTRPRPQLGQEARRRSRNAARQPAQLAAKRRCTSPRCSSSRTPST